MTASRTPPHGHAGPDTERSYWLSYRYVRLALVALLLLIVLAAVFEFVSTWHEGRACLRTSLSAYYWTPARAVFTGALLGSGVCLMALRSFPESEHIALVVAGAGAIIVALVPVPLERSGDDCSSIAGREGPEALSSAFLRETVQNNTFAVLLIGTAVLAVAAIFVPRRTFGHRAHRVGWTLLVLLLGLGWLWWVLLHTGTRSTTAMSSFDVFLWCGHATGAVCLFVSIAVVVGINHRRTAGRFWTLGDTPGRILLGMIALLVIVLPIGLVSLFTAHTRPDGPLWAHWLLALELGELALFAWFWGWQTFRVRDRLARPHTDPTGGEPATRGRRRS
jgi:hypothetical protein